jgi:hypothetical protein
VQYISPWCFLVDGWEADSYLSRSFTCKNLTLLSCACIVFENGMSMTSFESTFETLKHLRPPKRRRQTSDYSLSIETR